MSTPRITTSGPEVLQRLITGAFVGAVTLLVLVPAFQEVFAQLRSTQQTLPSQGGPFAGHVSTLLATGDLVLTLLPTVSTIGMAILAYTKIGWIGVGLYLLLSSAAAGMVAGSSVAVLTFVLCAGALTVVWAVKSRSRATRSMPTRQY